MPTLPEICEFFCREVQALEQVMVLLTSKEKCVAEVTFRKSVTKGVCCMDCVQEDQREEVRRRCTEPGVMA